MDPRPRALARSCCDYCPFLLSGARASVCILTCARATSALGILICARKRALARWIQDRARSRALVGTTARSRYLTLVRQYVCWRARATIVLLGRRSNWIARAGALDPRLFYWDNALVETRSLAHPFVGQINMRGFPNVAFKASTALRGVKKLGRCSLW